MAEKAGWQGRFFEDFKMDAVYQHPYGRTMIDTDNIWFTNITLNTNQIHFNDDYASKTAFKKPLVNSCFTFNLVTGMSTIDLSQNGIVLRWKNVRMPKPLFVGETVYAESKVLEKREIPGKNYGIVTTKTRGVTETGKVIMECTSEIMVSKKGTVLKKEDIDEMTKEMKKS